MMFATIKRWYARSTRQPRQPRVLDMRHLRGWGNHITWFNEGTRVYGHMPRRPANGDILIDYDGHRYELFDVKLEADPPDMFFARVRRLPLA